MSTRMPFALPLYVGGKRLSSAKFRVSPDAAVPSSVTANVLFVSSPLTVGVNVVFSWVQFVPTWAPDMLNEAEARMAPEELWSEMFRGPEKAELLGKR